MGLDSILLPFVGREYKESVVLWDRVLYKSLVVILLSRLNPLLGMVLQGVASLPWDRIPSHGF